MSEIEESEQILRAYYAEPSKETAGPAINMLRTQLAESQNQLAALECFVMDFLWAEPNANWQQIKALEEHMKNRELTYATKNVRQ
jgi:hypothetical protein